MSDDDKGRKWRWPRKGTIAEVAALVSAAAALVAALTGHGPT